MKERKQNSGIPRETSHKTGPIFAAEFIGQSRTVFVYILVAATDFPKGKVFPSYVGNCRFIRISSNILRIGVASLLLWMRIGGTRRGRLIFEFRQWLILPLIITHDGLIVVCQITNAGSICKYLKQPKMGR